MGEGGEALALPDISFCLTLQLLGRLHEKSLPSSQAFNAAFRKFRTVGSRPSSPPQGDRSETPGLLQIFLGRSLTCANAILGPARLAAFVHEQGERVRLGSNGLHASPHRSRVCARPIIALPHLSSQPGTLPQLAEDRANKGAPAYTPAPGLSRIVRQRGRAFSQRSKDTARMTGHSYLFLFQQLAPSANVE